MANNVAILGGGIGGLGAAHHLVRAGVTDVHVYELGDRVGGKARSQMVAVGPGKAYPGEHGFRFFPHFYQHVVDTMKTIPAGGETVWDRLVGSSTAGVAYNGNLLEIPRPARLEEYARFIPTVVELLQTPGIGLEDAVRYTGVLLQFATSCQARREREYDNQSWSDFAHAATYTQDFQDLVLKASRNLSAMRAPVSSAATIGAISLQMIFDFHPLVRHLMDPLLHGPTDEMFLDPWYQHLASHGVVFHFGQELTGFDLDVATARLRSVRVGGQAVTARHYVSAIPLERLAALVTPEMAAFDAAFARLEQLAPTARGDMVGLQFFLDRDVPVVNGHVHYPKTPFALTSVSQAQFWTPKPNEQPGTPELQGILSVIISDWQTPNAAGMKAADYTKRQDLLDEVWRQIVASLPAGTLAGVNVLASHLDANVALGPFVNGTPLLVHPVGQLALRPDAETQIENLVLASDFVRTYTDLATMEGADEAARRAVSAILRREGVPPAKYPFVLPFTEGPIFDNAKRIDEIFFRLGLAHPMQAPSDLTADLAKRVEAHPTLAHLAPLATPFENVVARYVAIPRVDHSRPDQGLLERWEEALRRL